MWFGRGMSVVVTCQASVEVIVYFKLETIHLLTMTEKSYGDCENKPKLYQQAQTATC